MEVILKAEENVIGYAVMEVFNRNDAYDSQGAIILKSVLFPQIDGKYQSVSDEHVKTGIQKTKDEAIAINAATVEEVESELIGIIGFQNTPPGVSSSPKNIKMLYSEKNVVFYCKVDKGSLYVNSLSGVGAKNIEVLCNEQIWWEARERGENGQLIGGVVKYANIEIVLKTEKTIIGYVVIEAYAGNHPGYATIAKSVLFPQVNGANQNVSEEYVKTGIKKAIDSLYYAYP